MPQEEAGSMSSALLQDGALGWGFPPCSTAAPCMVLDKLPSWNLSSVTYPLGSLGQCETMWA